MYNVGQILFVVLNKKPQIIPVKITEQVVRRSIDGENIQYSVLVPTTSGDKTFELSDLDGEVYTSISDVESAMMSNAHAMIKKMSQKAYRVAENKFEYSSAVIDQPLTSHEIMLPDVTVPEEHNQATVQLEDGTIAKVSLPENLDVNIPNQN